MILLLIYMLENMDMKNIEKIQKNIITIQNESGGKLWFATDINNDIVGTIAIYKHNDEEMKLKRFLQEHLKSLKKQ